MNLESINFGKKSENNTKEKNNNLLKIIKGSIISIITTMIFLTIFAILLTYTEISENTIFPVVLVISGVSILIGSSITTKKLKKQGMINGGLIGLVYILFIYVISSLFTMQFNLNTNSIIMLSVCVIVGMIGGIIGINMKI